MERKPIAKNLHELFVSASVGIGRKSVDVSLDQKAFATTACELAVEKRTLARFTDDEKPGKKRVILSSACKPVLAVKAKVIFVLWPATLGSKSSEAVAANDPTGWTYANGVVPMEDDRNVAEIIFRMCESI